MNTKTVCSSVILSLLAAVPLQNEGLAAPVRRAVSSRQPISARTTNWDHYCKGDGQNYCEFLIYGGKSGYTENYNLEIGNQNISTASIKFSAALDDAPADPNFTSYCLQISINDNVLKSPFVLRTIQHGKPLGGPFGFSEQVIQLPDETFKYFRNGSNSIGYKLDCAPGGTWIVFKWSEVTIVTK